MQRRVIVIGAGLAGLTAAERLIDGGCEVTVLEASDRVGGRTRTRRDGFADGQYAEAGAEWIDTVHHRIHALIDRFGLSLDPDRTTWTSVRRWLFRDGRLLGPDQLHEIEPSLRDDLDQLDNRIAAIATGISRASHPELHPEAARYDAASVADLVDDLQLGELARLFATRNMQGEFAAEPRDVSLLFIAQQRAVYAESEARHGHVEAQRLKGGVSGISEALAASLPAGTIRFGELLVGVETVEGAGSGRAIVTTQKGVHEADAVVLACPLVPLRAVTFAPELPTVLAEAIGGLGYGTVTKTALQYPTRPWPSGYATTEGRAQRVYEPTASAPGAAGILMAYTGGDRGRQLGALSDAERMDVIESSEREMYPELPGRIGGFSVAWSADPLFGGSYAVYRPGEVCRYWRALRQAHGRIHLAGEHAATWTGYLEGAVESGDAVAARLLASD